MASSSYERLSTQDGSFIIFEGPGTHMHVSAVAIFEQGPLVTSEGGLDIARLRSYVESRLHLLPRYRQRLQFTPLQRHAIWVDDDRFNLEYHVRHTSLPTPGSEQQLKNLAGRIMSQQLDREKPLWEMWFVEGLEGGRFAMISKVHHCMVDGASGVGVMTALLSESKEERVEPGPRWVPRPHPGRGELLRDEVLHRISAPVTSAADALLGAVRKPREASAQLADSADAMWQALDAGLHVHGTTPLNQPIGTHRRIDWCVLELGGVKEIKQQLEGTVNDVVLAVVAGAVRRFLKGRGVALKELDFRVAIPVNMRSGSEETSGGNKVSAWFMTLPVGEKDPLRRFGAIKQETRRLKGSKAARGIEIFTKITEWTGSQLLTSLGVRFASSVGPYNMIVTNVPGPRSPLYCLGARLEVMLPQLPLFENQGLGVAVMSYVDKVAVGAIADWDLVPDVAAFTRAVESSFRELHEAAC